MISVFPTQSISFDIRRNVFGLVGQDQHETPKEDTLYVPFPSHRLNNPIASNRRRFQQQRIFFLPHWIWLDGEDGLQNSFGPQQAQHMERTSAAMLSSLHNNTLSRASSGLTPAAVQLQVQVPVHMR